MYPRPATRGNAIAKAASYARGDMLGKLYILCEGQKTVSTKKLERILDDIADDLKTDALFIKNLSNKIEGE